MLFIARQIKMAFPSHMLMINITSMMGNWKDHREKIGIPLWSHEPSASCSFYTLRLLLMPYYFFFCLLFTIFREVSMIHLSSTCFAYIPIYIALLGV